MDPNHRRLLAPGSGGRVSLDGVHGSVPPGSAQGRGLAVRKPQDKILLPNLDVVAHGDVPPPCCDWPGFHWGRVQKLQQGAGHRRNGCSLGGVFVNASERIRNQLHQGKPLIKYFFVV